MKQFKHVEIVHLIVTRQGVVPCKTDDDITGFWAADPLTETLKAGIMDGPYYFHNEIRFANVFIPKQ